MGTRRTHEERLFSAAVLRRSFDVRGASDAEGFRFVYQGVLRDLGLDDAEVTAFLEAHRAEVDAALAAGGARR